MKYDINSMVPKLEAVTPFSFCCLWPPAFKIVKNQSVFMTCYAKRKNEGVLFSAHAPVNGDRLLFPDVLRIKSGVH